MFNLIGDCVQRYPRLTLSVLLGLGFLIDMLIVLVLFVDWQK